jgi:uncharacterized protein (TIGR00288 family)
VTEPRLKIAVFIDFDNIEIGVKSTLNTQFEPGLVLDALKERGEVISKTAYADWKRADEYSRSLTQHAIKLVQRNLTPGGDKNGADINLALDALELAFTHPHINAFAIVGGDSDFITLVEKLKQYDKKVFVIGGRAFASVIMQRNCNEFIAYENLLGPASPTRRPSDRGARPPAQLPVTQVFPLVKRALEILSEREVTPQLGLLKSTLLQLDSTFSERSYGVGSFRDFADKLASAGLITIKQAGRSVHVELREDAAPSPEPVEPSDTPAAEAAPVADAAAPERPAAVTAPDPARMADAVKIVRSVFQSGQPRRWPMYIRNVKQILRSAEPGFDEHKFGFNSIVDLLRACQREGLLRLERDRQGVLRVFAGPSLHAARPEETRIDEAAPIAIVEGAPAETEVVEEVIVEEEAPAVTAVVERAADAPATAAEPGEPDLEEPAAKRPRRRRAAPAGGARKRTAGPKASRVPRARKNASATTE